MKKDELDRMIGIIDFKRAEDELLAKASRRTSRWYKIRASLLRPFRAIAWRLYGRRRAFARQRQLALATITAPWQKSFAIFLGPTITPRDMHEPAPDVSGNPRSSKWQLPPDDTN